MKQASGEIAVSYIPTDLQPADMLTKHLTKEKLDRCKERVRIRSLSSLQTMIAACCFFTLVCPSVQMFHAASPVVWRPIQNQVIRGSVGVSYLIEMDPLCDRMTDANDWCRDIMKRHVYDLIEKNCIGSALVREKREPVSLILFLGAISAVGGLSIVNFGMTVANTVKISNLKEEMNGKIAEIHEIQKMMNADIITLRDGFNNFTADFVRKEKMFLTASEFAATTVVFADGLKKFFRNWGSGVVTEDMVFLINIPLPADVPANRLKTLSCNWDKEKKSMAIELVGQMISKDEVVMEAEAFTLYEVKGDQMCLTQYTGTKRVIFNRHANATCKVRKTSKRNLYLEMKAGESCEQAKDVWKEGKCFRKEDLNPMDVIQMEEVGYGMYVFCNGYTISIFGATIHCPEFVFVLPSNASFTLNGMRYEAKAGSHTAIITPELLTSWQHAINAHLLPGDNPYQIHTRSEEIESRIEWNQRMQTQQVITWGAAALAVTALIAGVLGTRWFMRRKQRRGRTSGRTTITGRTIAEAVGVRDSGSVGIDGSLQSSDSASRRRSEIEA